MAGLLILLGILALGAGLLFLSEATTGVGIIGVACFLGILARIAQASEQHQKLMDALGLEEGETEAEAAEPVATE